MNFSCGRLWTKPAKLLIKEKCPSGRWSCTATGYVGRGHNLTETLADPTAHAEMQALTAATGAIGGKYLNECRLYVTVEPCVMCAGACFWCQVGQVIYGAPDPKRGASLHTPSLFHPKTQVRTGILEQECREWMETFFRKLRF